MIIVKVSYTVQSAFAQKNQENINRFMLDFKRLTTNEFRYVSYLCEDGRTFVHLSHFKNEEIQHQLLQVPSFKEFQLQRDQRLEMQPKIEYLSAVASSEDLLGTG